jgi:hypothetical protein
MANNRKVEKLLNQKNKIESELRKIREECSHTQRTVKQIPRGEGRQTDTRWVCDECAKTVGYPSQFDIDKFLNKRKK